MDGLCLIGRRHVVHLANKPDLCAAAAGLPVDVANALPVVANDVDDGAEGVPDLDAADKIPHFTRAIPSLAFGASIKNAPLAELQAALMSLGVPHNDLTKDRCWAALEARQAADKGNNQKVDHGCILETHGVVCPGCDAAANILAILVQAIDPDGGVQARAATRATAERSRCDAQAAHVMVEANVVHVNVDGAQQNRKCAEKAACGSVMCSGARCRTPGPLRVNPLEQGRWHCVACWADGDAAKTAYLKADAVPDGAKGEFFCAECERLEKPPAMVLTSAGRASAAGKALSVARATHASRNRAGWSHEVPAPLTADAQAAAAIAALQLRALEIAEALAHAAVANTQKCAYNRDIRDQKRRHLIAVMDYKRNIESTRTRNERLSDTFKHGHASLFGVTFVFRDDKNETQVYNTGIFTPDKVHDVHAVAASVRRAMRMLSYAAVLSGGNAGKIAAAEGALRESELAAFRIELDLRPVPPALLAQVDEGITSMSVWVDNASG